MESGAKKRVVVSLHNLPVELQEEVKRRYPRGYAEQMIRVDKGGGDFFCGIVFETEDTSYFVKINVKVDDKSKIEEEEDKGYYDEEIKGAEDIADPDSEEDEED